MMPRRQRNGKEEEERKTEQTEQAEQRNHSDSRIKTVGDHERALGMSDHQRCHGFGSKSALCQLCKQMG